MMRILHIAHYNRFPHTPETFFGQNRNGLERFLESLIRNDMENEHYIFYFNHYDNSIEVHGIDKDGEIYFYTHYLHVAIHNENEVRKVLEQLTQIIIFDVIHIHYLKSYTKVVPQLFQNLGFEAILTTVHDESFLGVEYGENQAYAYDYQVKAFFEHNKRVVFLHAVSERRYLQLYREQLENKHVRIPLGAPKVQKLHLNTQKKENFCVLMLGSLNQAKGFDVIQELESLLPASIELHLLGSADGRFLNVIEHGAYRSEQLQERVSSINPDVILIPSIVEEVFSYTALEATALGLPIVAFPVGALADIEKEKRGFVAEEKSTKSMLKLLIELSEKRKDVDTWNNLVEKIQELSLMTEAEMTVAYMREYDALCQVANNTPMNMPLLAKQNVLTMKQKEGQFLEKSEALDVCTSQIPPLKQKRGLRMIRKFKSVIANRGGVKNTVRNISHFAKKHGIVGSYYRATNIEKFNQYVYHRWLKENEVSYTEKEVQTILGQLKIKPRFSFLIPVYNVEEVYLRTCIDSILAQQYPHWELCLADDASTQSHIRPILEAYMQKDSRIKVVFREENGHISAATNSALEIATGDFIALVDNDDFIRPNALLEVAKLIDEHPDAEMIYTDEDKTDAEGKVRLSPYFKPDWSPDAFWGHMYLCHLGVYKTEIARQIGGFRIGYEGAQDYDFALRFSERTTHIYHVPQILYHWRMIPTSTAASGDNKSYAYDASIRAKASAIERRGYNGIVEVEARQLSTNVYFRPEQADFISIIIPTKDHGSDVKRLLDAIYSYSTWSNFEIILIDNNTTDEESLNIFHQLQNEHANLRVVQMPFAFNYSKLNNEAVKYAKGNLLLFLNNDMEIITHDWLERLAGQAKLPYAGAVGGKLYYANDRVQHAGVISLQNAPVHAFHNFHRGELGYFGRLSLTYNYLAVTGACLMVERAKFEEVGGFDEEHLPIAYQDVDFCLKLHEKGYFNAVRADVELYHFESQTRGYEDSSEKCLRMENEKAILNERWSHYLQEDPFYNRNLTDEKVDFTLK